MPRRLLNAATAVSLLLCLASAVLLGRSAGRTDVLMVAGPGDGCFLLTSNVGGWVEFTVMPDGFGARGVRAWSVRSVPFAGGPLVTPGPVRMWQRPSDAWSWRPGVVPGEFVLRHGTPALLVDDQTGRPLLNRWAVLRPGAWGNAAPGSPHWRFPETWELRVPHWALVLLTAALPAVRGARRAAGAVRRRVAHRAGLCRRCGYDLRATPDRCPECGQTSGGANARAVDSGES